MCCFFVVRCVSFALCVVRCLFCVVWFVLMLGACFLWFGFLLMVLDSSFLVNGTWFPAFGNSFFVGVVRCSFRVSCYT